MKRFLTFMMALALVLCAACGKQTETPVTPDQPPVQEQPAQPSESDNSPQPELDNDLEPLAGKVAVLTTNAELQNASAETVDTEGNVILMDMAVTLEQGTLVYVESQEDTLCTVALLAGEPPYPKGQLNADQLSAQTELLLQAQQVILNDTPSYAAAGGETLLEKRSGVAQVELRNASWWKVSLPGGGESFWIRETDLTWDWPLPDMLEPPQPPAEPEVPVVVEPEGFVSVTKLPEGIPGVEQVLQFIPLQGGASVLLAKGGEKGWIVTYDYMVAEVLDQMEVAVGDQAQMALMDAGTLYYYDGQKEWEILIGGRMGLSSREYDINRRLMMGDKQISGVNGSILVDGAVVLEAQPGKDAYVLVGILDDHRLLYNAYGAATNLSGTYGIYDHATGEKKLLTTLGQQVVGAWGDTLLIARQHAGGLYELGKFDLTDYSFTALNIGHEKIDQRVEHIWCSNDGTQMLVTWEDDAGLHVQIFDLESQEERYAWTAPAGEGWNFRIADGSNLAVWQGRPEDLTVWNVNY